MKSFMNLLMVFFILVCFGCFASTVPVERPQIQQPQEVKISIDSNQPIEKINLGDHINKSMEVENRSGELSQLSFIIGDQAFVKIFSGLSTSDVTRLWNDFCVLEYDTDIRRVNLFINSPGGDAFQGLALADQIKRAQRRGFKIIAHASGIVASAAVPVFAVCDVRLAAPGTIFMVHEAALWKWPGRETASDIRSQNTLFDLLRERYIGILADHTDLEKVDWQGMETNTTWFSAEKAKEWGLVDKIE